MEFAFYSALEWPETKQTTLCECVMVINFCVIKRIDCPESFSASSFALIGMNDFAFLLWLCMASPTALPFNFSILTYLRDRSANYLLTAQPAKGGRLPSAMSPWLYPSCTCHVSAAHKPTWAGAQRSFCSLRGIWCLHEWGMAKG